MRIKVDGRLYDVPDDATPDEIDQISKPRSESEMMADLAAADAAGDTQLAQHIAGQIKAARTAEQPGLLRRAMTWASTPFENVKPILEQQAATRGAAPLGLDKNSSDLAAGAHSFISGIQGFQGEPAEGADRMARFRGEHPLAAFVLPMIGAMGKPMMIPTQTPRAVAAAPMAAAPAVTATVEQAASQAAPAAANAYEAAARGTKVSELVKAIDANAGVHLGVDPRDPRFAEALSSLPEQWWNGMGQVAKINKPSQTTIDQTVGFFRDRASQAGRAAQDVPAPAPVPTSVPPPPAQGPAPFTLGTQLQQAGSKLSNLPRTPWSPLDFIMGAHGWTTGGTLRGAAEAAAMKAVRNYGPGVAGSALSGAGKAVDAIPPQLLAGAVQAAGGATQSPRLLDILAQLRANRSTQPITSNE